MFSNKTPRIAVNLDYTVLSRTTLYCNDGNKNDKNNSRTIEAQIVRQKLKNNEPRPNFTGSYKKKRASSPHDICRIQLFQKGCHSQ